MKAVIHMRVDPELKKAAQDEALLDHIDLSAFVSIALSREIERRRIDRKRSEISTTRESKPTKVL